MLCEYSKFWIEQLLQYSICNEYNYSKFSNTYHHQFVTYLTEWRRFFTLETTPSSQQKQQAWSCLLAHYGPPSTDTPITETTTVRCHKNSWIYLISTYYWWLLRPTITIRFHSKFQIIAQLFDSKWKNTIRTAPVVTKACMIQSCLFVNTTGSVHIFVVMCIRIHSMRRSQYSYIGILSDRPSQNAELSQNISRKLAPSS